jgi:serine/threonine protein kinase
MTSAARQTIGRYEVIRDIGKGAQGAVYLGRDPTLDRLVAIKVLTNQDAALNSMSDDGAPLEGRISSKLKHPNIIPIFDAGEFVVGPYLVFEYVEGKTLAETLKQSGPVPVEEAAPLITAILQAVATAHNAEVLHLDLNPRNVLIDSDGVPRVMDFGLAQYVSNAHEPKESATGTLRYMAPEHFAGRALGPWTDVFALGSTFYEVVTGQNAMTGTRLEEIQGKIIRGEVDLSLLDSDPHGKAFARFLSGALEKSESGRYADCSAMAEAFALLLSEAGLVNKAEVNGPRHSTIEFLLRRMQRTGDFPTISRTMSDINRLTGDDADANADKLAAVILKDFALTGKLLKLVNSAFYNSRSVEITKISEAVVFLGVEQVRMTANSLTFFGHMKSDSTTLKDSMTKSFLGGMMARHLAQQARLRGSEEAFICGMCQNLGENLVIHYFPDEFADIGAVVRAEELGKSAAARGVLGVSYAELGAAVAKTWNLPGSIIEAIRGVPRGTVQKPGTTAEHLRDIAVFANELCDLFDRHETGDIDPAMRELLARFAASIAIEPEYCLKLVGAGLEKLKQFAPIFEINFATSSYCQSVQRWLDQQIEQPEAAVEKTA